MTVAAEWLAFAPKPRLLSGQDRWNVFLSYRSVNRSWVLNLYDALRELGHAVFLDQSVLKPGDELMIELQDALQASQAGVLIWSSSTQDSKWVLREYQVLERLAAKNPGFRFVPLKLDQSELPPFAESKLFLDFSSHPDGPNGGELLRLLYGIAGQPLSEPALRFAADQDEAALQALNQIKAAIDIGNAKRLVELSQKGDLPWRVSATLGCRAAEGLTRLGHNDLALAMLVQVEKDFSKAIRPKQLRALALARRAAKAKDIDGLDEAQMILAELYAAGHRDPETVGILARTWMDRFQIDGDAVSLERSRDFYAEAFQSAPDDYYTGINAAAKSVFLGTAASLKDADLYAERVLAIVGTEPCPGDYWKTATIAEALLMQKKYGDAAKMYRSAVVMAPKEVGSHLTSWTQAARLMDKLGTNAEAQALVRQAFGSIVPDPNKS